MKKPTQGRTRRTKSTTTKREASKKATARTEVGYALLGPRSEVKANEVQTRTVVGAMKAKVFKHGVADGVIAQEFGTTLLTLFRWAAHELYGYPDFFDFAEAELDVSRAAAYRYLRVARYATPKQAEWGVPTCLAAGRLVEYLRADEPRWKKLGLKKAPRTISDLAQVPFPLEDGAVLRFRGSVLHARDVTLALAILRGKKVPPRVPAALRHEDDRMRAGCANDPALKGVRTRVGIVRGKHSLRIDPPPGADLREILLALARSLEE